MHLQERLAQKKANIINRWHDSVLDTYAPDAAQFYKRQKDQFANPVGNTFRQGLQGVFQELLGDVNPEKIRLHLDPIIRIRAVQNFSPTQAVAFIFELKSIILDLLGKEFGVKKQWAEWNRFAAKIDSISLMAFDVYVACREKIYDLKANVERDKIYKAFSRAGLVAEIADEDRNPVPF